MSESTRAGRNSIPSLLNAINRLNDFAEGEGQKYYDAFITILASLFLMTAIGIFANIHGYLIVNILFSILVFVAVILTATHPKLLVLIFNLDIVTRIAPVLDTEGNVLDLFLRVSRKIAGIFMAFFLFLGIFSITGNVKVFFVGMVACIVVLVLKVQGVVGTITEKCAGLVVILCFGYILVCNVLTNTYLQASVDSVLGTRFSRSTYFTKPQVDAYKAQENLAEWNRYTCLDTYAEKGENRKATWERLIEASNVDPFSKKSSITSGEKSCLDEIKNGPEDESFKKNFGKTLKGVTSAFASTPKLVPCGTVSYKPRDFIGGKRIAPPSKCNIPYLVKVSGNYYQKFAVKSKPHPIPSTTGIKVNGMPQNEIRSMPIEDATIYGIALINDVPVKTTSYSYTDKEVIVNVNVSQTREAYKDITGTLQVQFYSKL